MRLQLNDYCMAEDGLEGRMVLISGATDGIGEALALACAALGAQLVLMSRNKQKLESLCTKLQETTGQAHLYYAIDHRRAGEVDYLKFAEFLSKQDRPLDSLVVNAGHIAALQGLRNYPLETWLRTVTVNQHAAFLLARSCIPALELSEDPSIVFSNHDCNSAYWGAYAVAKSAVLGLMEVLAQELDGDKPIRVNGVDPAPVRTKLRTAHFPGVHPHTYPAPDQVIAPYLYFIGPDSQGTTGINYKVNPDYSG
ncbi:MAG: SDR family NAD(P)-dependent oxidoreductase [Gammaproteobacteria bacterium]|nr:SDR family NAD(P)-dependent oxidoreductase [Gammaproteobacteria bacterium]